MIIRITGGLGNQMFQYALKLQIDKQLAGKTRCIVDTSFYENKKIHNGYELQRIFGIPNDESTYDQSYFESNKALRKICNKIGIHFIKNRHSLIETLFGYYEKMNSLPFKKPNFFLDGYWQSEDYFLGVRNTVREAYIFPELDEKNKMLLSEGKKQGQLVSIHVRRGDFKNSSAFVDLSKTDYYKNAIAYIKTHVSNPLYLVFSDEPEWASNMLKKYIGDNLITIDWNQGTDSYKDMQIMSLCDHNILANSSFSWWAGWLNSNPASIIIAPKRFYSDTKRDESHLLPKEWIKI